MRGKLSTTRVEEAHDEDDGDDGQPRRTLRNAAEAGIEKPAGAMNSAFDTGALKKRQQRPAAALFDATAVPIQQGVPLPPVRPGTRSAYAELWQRMQPGDMVRLPDRQAIGLHAYARSLKQQSAVRRLADGIKRVWKL